MRQAILTLSKLEYGQENSEDMVFYQKYFNFNDIKWMQVDSKGPTKLSKP